MITTRHLDFLDFQTPEQRIAVEQVLLEVRGHYDDKGKTPVTPSLSQYVTEGYRHEEPGVNVNDIVITYDILFDRLNIVSFIVDTEGCISYRVRGYANTNRTDDDRLTLYATGDFLVDGDILSWLA